MVSAFDGSARPQYVSHVSVFPKELRVTVGKVVYRLRVVYGEEVYERYVVRSATDKVMSWEIATDEESIDVVKEAMRDERPWFIERNGGKEIRPIKVPAIDAGERAKRVQLVVMIEKHMLGIEPDDRELVLEDEDLHRIIAALKG